MTVTVSSAEAKRVAPRTVVRCRNLPNGVKLPESGPGFRIPETWSRRGLNWGTPELVGLTKRAAKKVAKEMPGSTLYVADMSPRGGGASAWHKTHKKGVDVDILFYMLDESGEPAKPPAAMIRFNGEGHGAATDNFGNPVPPLRFDVARNWQLVRALITDPEVTVARILVSSQLRQELLDHATRKGESQKMIARARELLLQPRKALPHDDHFHVRIPERGSSCPVVAARPAPRAKLAQKAKKSPPASKARR